MDAQQQHDLEMSDYKPAPDSRQRLEALLAQKSAASSETLPTGASDPIEVAMRNHPGLTREEAEKMAEAFGF
jgi:hypothetical protein